MKPIRNLTVISTFVLALAISCNKDTDDPNVIYAAINKTITASNPTKIDSFDINLDTRTDFGILAGRSSTGDTIVCYMTGVDVQVCYIDSTRHLGIAYDVKPLSKNEAPELVSTAKRWNRAAFLGAKFGTDIYGVAGAGDKFVPVVLRNLLTNKNHYGWVRINVSADFTTLKIIDAAYNVVPEIPVKMGVH